MREYTRLVSGIPHTFQLDDDDAERLGLTAADRVEQPKAKAETPNKARTAQNKGA